MRILAADRPHDGQKTPLLLARKVAVTVPTSYPECGRSGIVPARQKLRGDYPPHPLVPPSLALRGSLGSRFLAIHGVRGASGGASVPRNFSATGSGHTSRKRVDGRSNRKYSKSSVVPAIRGGRGRLPCRPVKMVEKVKSQRCLISQPIGGRSIRGEKLAQLENESSRELEIEVSSIAAAAYNHEPRCSLGISNLKAIFKDLAKT